MTTAVSEQTGAWLAAFTGQKPAAPWAPVFGGGNIPEEAQAQLAKHASLDRNAFVALNTAFLHEVAFFRVPRGEVRQEPIQISYSSAPGGGLLPVTHPRSLIVVGADAHCTIVETYQGTGRYFTNAVTEIVVGDGAVVDHYKVQRESAEAFHVATMQVTLGRSANFCSHSIALGGALVRNDAN